MNDFQPTEDQAQQERLRLYEQFLEPDKKHLARMRDDALNAGQGINTGFKMFSKSATGEQKDFTLWIPKYTVTMLCARTGGGKTAWMANLAWRMSLGGATGLFITLEEPGFAIRSKLLASYTRFINPDFSALWSSYVQATKAIAGKTEIKEMDEFNKSVMNKLRIIDANSSVNLDKVCTPNIMYDPQDIADLIDYRNHHSDKPLDYVIIDFGQLMEDRGGNNTQSYLRMKAVMQACKNLASGHGIAVIIGAQLKREVAFMPIWEWEPEHIRDGSDMEQAASLILATGRDKEYEIDPTHQMALRVLKNRYGPQNVAGMFNIDFEHCYIPQQGKVPEDD